MTKTTRVNLFLILLLLAQNAWSLPDLTQEEKKFAQRIQAACGQHMSFDLHDYSYGRDEGSLYSNNHFEDAALLAAAIAKACEIDPRNKRILERVKTVFVKRGSIQQRKLIQRKNGDLVYLAGRLRAEAKESKDDLIRRDLQNVLKLSFVKPPELVVEKKKEENKKAEEDRAQQSAERDRKIQEAVLWYQEEVKKISATPGPEMAQKLEELTKVYEEKIRALTTP